MTPDEEDDFQKRTHMNAAAVRKHIIEAALRGGYSFELIIHAIHDNQLSDIMAYIEKGAILADLKT